MATQQTPWADGRDTAPRPQSAGAVHAVKFSFDHSVAVANANVVELGMLPAFAHIVDAILIPEGDFESATCKVGLMTGTAGDGVTARTVGAEIFAAATALTATVRATLALGFNITPVDYPRGIGIDYSADVTAVAAKKLTLILFYVQ